MPIIFALSILLFPQVISGFMIASSNPFFQNVGQILADFVANGWLYSITYFILVVAFTYFYTAITFDPESMSENLQKNGAFVPGIRPGKQTSEYIGDIVTRITFIGAIFLGVVAVIPVIMQSLTGIQALAIGGTGILIVVSVILDLFKRIDAQVSMREY
jgi:preprotein translocase subunit SecY